MFDYFSSGKVFDSTYQRLVVFIPWDCKNTSERGCHAEVTPRIPLSLLRSRAQFFVWPAHLLLVQRLPCLRLCFLKPQVLSEERQPCRLMTNVNKNEPQSPFVVPIVSLS